MKEDRGPLARIGSRRLARICCLTVFILAYA